LGKNKNGQSVGAVNAQGENNMRKNKAAIALLALPLILFAISFCSKPDATISAPARIFSEEWINSAPPPAGQELDNEHDVQKYMMIDGKKYLIIELYVLMDTETGEAIDFRTRDRLKRGK
jgi:hypothetical protein